MEPLEVKRLEEMGLHDGRRCVFHDCAADRSRDELGPAHGTILAGAPRILLAVVAVAAEGRLRARWHLRRTEVSMSGAQNESLLPAVLDSWDRNNAILINLLRLVPEGGFEVRAMEGSPSVAELFMHMHFVRLVFISEDAPDLAVEVPRDEWSDERDPDRIAQMLNDSARAVREAVRSRVEAGKEMVMHYDHPILFLQHMIWHEGYHHGQIKLALKLTGQQLADQEVGRGTWGVWMRKSK
jgi:uncharacterized damage-inducible protein DinB